MPAWPPGIESGELENFMWRNGIPRSEPDWIFARDNESVPCSHFFVIEAN